MSDDVLTSKETKEIIAKVSEEFFTLKYDNSVLEASKKENNKRITELEKQLLEIMEDDGLESFGTNSGNLSRKINVHPNIDDFPTFIDWVYKGKAFEFLPKSVNAAPVREMLQESNQIPPGLSTYEKETLNTRINAQFRSELENKRSQK